MHRHERTIRPDFILIGAMKCATSTLHDQLAAHRSFYMSTPKEPNFFSNDEVYAKGIRWYQSLFADAKDDQILGESSTHYTMLPTYPGTIDRLKAFCPDLKCIYIMRHPVERLVSHYIHEWTQGVISCDIDRAIEEFPELFEYSRYSMQIMPYLQTYGPASVLPMFAERFRHNPQHELETIFKFLDVKEIPCWRNDIRNNVSAQRLRTCGWRDALVQNPILSIVRRTLVPKNVRRWIRSLWTMKERPAPSPSSLKKITQLFDEDLKILGDMLGLELSCQTFSQTVIAPNQIRWKM